MKNKTVSRVCLVILAVIFLGIVLVPSLIDLSGKNNESIKIKYAAEAVEYKKTYAFIPVSKTVYYVAVLEDESVAIVKGTKSWYKKNFTSYGVAKGGNLVTVEGTLEKMPYKVNNEMTSVYSMLSVGGPIDYAYEKTECVDATTKSYAIKGIVTAAVAVVLAVVFLIGLKKNWLQKTAIVVILSCGTIAVLLFGVHVMIGR